MASKNWLLDPESTPESIFIISAIESPGGNRKTCNKYQSPAYDTKDRHFK